MDGQKRFSLQIFSPQNLFYLFIFLLPWQTRYIFHEGVLNEGYFEYGTFSLYATDLLFVVILIWVLIRKYFSEIPFVQNAKEANPWLIVSFFEIWVFLSILWAQDFDISLYFYIRVLQGIGFIYLLSQINFSPKLIRLSFVAAAVLQAIFAFVQFTSQQVIAIKWLGLASHEAFGAGQFVIENHAGRWLRSYGSFEHPNILGGFLAMAFVLHLSYYYKPLKKQSHRILLFSTTLLLLLGIMTTFSKSATLGVLVGMFMFFVLKAKESKLRHKMYIGAVFVALFLFGMIYREQIITRIVGTQRLEIRSQKERISQYNEAIGLIMWRPIRGWGAGQYTLSLHSEIDKKRAYYDYQPIHNIYLLIGAELGLVGLFLFLIVIIYPTPIFPRNPIFIMVPSQYALLFTLLTIGLFDHYLWSLQSGRWMLFFAIGLMYRTLILQQRLGFSLFNRFNS